MHEDSTIDGQMAQVVMQLGDMDQWQKCLTNRICAGTGRKKRRRDEKQQEVEAAMEGTL